MCIVEKLAAYLNFFGSGIEVRNADNFRIGIGTYDGDRAIEAIEDVQLVASIIVNDSGGAFTGLDDSCAGAGWRDRDDVVRSHSGDVSGGAICIPCNPAWIAEGLGTLHF